MHMQVGCSKVCNVLQKWLSCGRKRLLIYIYICITKFSNYYFKLLYVASSWQFVSVHVVAVLFVENLPKSTSKTLQDTSYVGTNDLTKIVTLIIYINK